MNRQDIEEAIKRVGDRAKPYDHEITLATVAEAWLETEDWIKAGGNTQIVPARLLKHMERLLNPEPKTDLQKVRAFIMHDLGPDGPGTQDRIVRFIDKLEKEKP